MVRTGSSPKVDYTLRPAKSAERRMIVETLSRLNHLFHVEDYVYIGMGSLYFHDFVLLHRRLGIKKMVSVEFAYERERLEFNRPLSCIEIVIGDITEKLFQQPLAELPHVVWLDFESQVTQGILDTIRQFTLLAHPFSALFVTVNCERVKEENWDAWRHDFFPELNAERPREVKEWATLIRGMVVAAAESGLDIRRKSGMDGTGNIAFKQFFNVLYSDGAQMLTVGGVLVRDADTPQWEACRMSDISYMRDNEDPYEIEVPRLTRREVQRLVRELPAGGEAFRKVADELKIPTGEAKKLAKTYRHSPIFLEVEET